MQGYADYGCVRVQVQTDPFLQQRAARSRSRFDFAQDDTQSSSTGAPMNGAASGLGFAQWANPAAGVLDIQPVTFPVDVMCATVWGL